MTMKVRFQKFTSRPFKDTVYHNLDCYDEQHGLPLTMSVDDANHISEIFKTLKFGSEITLSVRLIELKGGKRGEYRLNCYDVKVN